MVSFKHIPRGFRWCARAWHSQCDSVIIEFIQSCRRLHAGNVPAKLTLSWMVSQQCTIQMSRLEISQYIQSLYLSFFFNPSLPRLPLSTFTRMCAYTFTGCMPDKDGVRLIIKEHAVRAETQGVGDVVGRQRAFHYLKSTRTSWQSCFTRWFFYCFYLWKK